MKKLMIALAAVAMAISVNAAQWTWGISPLSTMQDPGSTSGEAPLASGTAYLFAYSTEAAAKAALGAFVDDFAKGTLSTTGYTATQTIENGVLTANVAMDNDPYSGITKGTTVYWAMIATTTVKGTDYLFADYTSASRNADGKNRAVTFSEAGNTAVLDASKSYSSAGYYTAAPEPTSGLLLLLGMAGLALRRRRA